MSDDVQEGEVVSILGVNIALLSWEIYITTKVNLLSSAQGIQWFYRDEATVDIPVQKETWQFLSHIETPQKIENVFFLRF